MQELLARSLSKTPRWFRIIRNSGIVLTGIGTALLTAPVSLPVIIVTIAGYLIVAGSVAAIISQTANPNE